MARPSRHGATVLKLGLGAAVVAVIALAYVDLRREEARALEDFVAEQRALAGSTAEALGARLDAVEGALELAAQIGDEAHLEALVGPDGPGLGAELREGDVVRRAGVPLPEGVDAHATRRVLRAGAAQREVLLLVDLDRLLSTTEDALAAKKVPQRLLLTDGAGSRIALGAGPRLDGHELPEIDALFEAMAQGAAGTQLLGHAASDSLGLHPRMAVAAYGPVRSRVGQWSLAVVTSARRVRDRGYVAGYRLLIATGVVSLLVGVFAIVLQRRARRELELEQSLHLAEQTAALRERSEKMMEMLPLGVLAVDAGRRITSANSWMQERGFSPGTTLPSELEQLVVEARASGAQVSRRGLDLHLATRSELDAYAVPLGRPMADVDCFLVLHDRTEERRLERTLVRAEKLGTIGTLAAGVAHEVGTPLGIISGRAEQLLERASEGPDGDALRKGVTSILGQVDKVGKTIRQLLDFSRVRPIEAQPIGPAQAVAGAASLLEHRFRQHEVQLHLEVSPATATVLADPGQLEQVLVNLLVNACDACRPGGNVWARAVETHGQVVLSIVDDGVGIAAEQLPLVLDPFFTTKKRGQGTGLGLSIVADIVRNHGGTLELDSVVGQGTTVRVILPGAAS